MNACVQELFESERVCTSTKLLRNILDDTYENSDLNKPMKKQCEYLLEEQITELLKLLQIFKELFYGTLGTCKIDPLD